MPTDIPARTRSIFGPDGQVVALCSLLPCLVTLLLAHAHPSISGAFVLLGQLS